MQYSNKTLYDPFTDEMFQKPVIDVFEDRTRPALDGSEISYQYLHGYFEGTNVKFVFCFPQKEAYQGRFFQHLSPFPGPDEELAALEKTGEDDFIAFALTHGACYVESNMGSGAVFGSEADATIFYRSSAAVAEYCRKKAQELFGEHRVYGYVYGGSGGGYKTMSCVENTPSWDGAVPFVIGSPVSLPNCLTVGTNASRLLRHCCVQISDALEPGGSGDMYAGLNEEEQAALRELVLMGCPPRLCRYLTGDDDGALPVLTPTVKMLDPEYFTDFWTKPGYLGTAENSSALRDRIHMRTRVVKAGILAKDEAQENKYPKDVTPEGMNREDGEAQENKSAIDDRNGTDDAWQKMMMDGSAAYIEVEEVPTGEDLYLRGVDMVFESGKAKGKKLRLGKIRDQKLIPGMSFGTDDIAEVISMIEPGDEVFLDNSDYIAIQTYHRHQVPPDPSFHAWDQYKDEQGNSIYPQRPMVISYGFTAGGCGSVQDGHIQSKVIVMNNLMDGDFPWQADWYRRKVEEVYQDQAKDCFRLWYNDNCPHGDASEVGDNLRVVSYLGMLRQALLDVAYWAETGEAPTPTSGYRMEDNQVILFDTPTARGGVQPMVTLLAEGEVCAKVKVGECVTFTAKVEMPPAAGTFAEADWSFEGEQDFPYEGTVKEEGVETVCRKTGDGAGDGTDSVAETRYAVLEAKHSYSQPGTYYPVVRVISNRDKKDGYTRLRNLARACVIVEA